MDGSSGRTIANNSGNREASVSFTTMRHEVRATWSYLIVERLHRAASAHQEGIGDELERREIDVSLAGRGEFDEAAVEPGIFGIRGIDELFVSRDQSGPA